MDFVEGGSNDKGISRPSALWSPQQSSRRKIDCAGCGWCFLIAFVPFVGGIILLVFTVQDSAPGENLYGKNPKGVAA
jgi:Protein of unknown function (DUF805)